MQKLLEFREVDVRDVVKEQDMSNNVLLLASQLRDRAECLTLLLQYTKGITVSTVTPHKFEALRLACVHDNEQGVKLLLDFCTVGGCPDTKAVGYANDIQRTFEMHDTSDKVQIRVNNFVSVCLPLG